MPCVWYETVVTQVALARANGVTVDGGIELAVESKEHAHRPRYLQLWLIDVGIQGVPQPEALAAKVPDKRRLMLDVDVDVLSS